MESETEDPPVPVTEVLGFDEAAVPDDPVADKPEPPFPRRVSLEPPKACDSGRALLLCSILLPLSLVLFD
jgi:hypothetical protein